MRLQRYNSTIYMEGRQVTLVPVSSQKTKNQKNMNNQGAEEEGGQTQYSQLSYPNSKAHFIYTEQCALVKKEGVAHGVTMEEPSVRVHYG